ncbi:MAG: NADH-quinone oxidoreductase subunit C [Deltaproteobacteria bacterium]
MIENIIEIKKVYLLDEVKKLKKAGYRFVTASCVDLGSDFMIYYHFDKDTQMKHLKIISSKEEEIPSISEIYFAGALPENEMKDLFGIRIKGLVLDYGGKFMITGDVEAAPFAKPPSLPEKGSEQ